MLEITNLEQIIPQSLLDGLNEQAFNEIVSGLAEAARDEWIRLANKEFSTTRSTYVSAIMPVAIRPGVATISLVGDLPNMLEHGMPRQEMHETLLGPNVPLVPLGKKGKHPSKDGGVYRAIPFRHSVPGTSGAVGPAMGSAYTGHKLVQDAKKMGRKVYQAAKQLSPTLGGPGGPVAYGSRLPAKTGGTPKLRDHHAVDIYAGMIRAQKTYEDATQGFYMTFRTIALDGSGNKKGSSPWVRKKTKGRELSKKVNSYVQEQAPLAFEAYVAGLTK